MTKLTFEEWRKKVGTVPVSDQTREAFKSFDNVDVDEQIDSALRQEYQRYLSMEDNNE